MRGTALLKMIDTLRYEDILVSIFDQNILLDNKSLYPFVTLNTPNYDCAQTDFLHTLQKLLVFTHA